MENGAFLDEDYFERLLEEIREIRLSERRLYQKITDIYATSVDYDKDSPLTKAFFCECAEQNALRHYRQHHRRTDYGQSGQPRGAYGAFHMGERAGREDSQIRCYRCKELPQKRRIGSNGTAGQLVS